MKTFFISSTFKDMQAERDILHERIFPRLRHVIKQYGDDVQEVDLRWGVDTVNMTEEESGHEVLKICIDAIDRCKPYLVVLLGERYGWIPGKTIVDQARDQRISDRYEDEMSITELEIRYGALLGEDTFERCIFCFRDPAVLQRIDDDSKPIYQPESPRHADRLAVLKSHIRQRKDAIILEYTADWDRERHALCGLEDFETRLYDRLEAMIRRDFADRQTKDQMERQVEETELIKTGYLSSYVRRYPEEFQISRELYNFQQQIAMGNPRMTDCLLVCGDAGSGKSALMAYMG
ncbi:MAG: DUF4062 domain-containing protein, partial [Firmicutes bacterium]|nr:DUF4062 domain-containing protein [Bacillota bacterium]